MLEQVVRLLGHNEESAQSGIIKELTRVERTKKREGMHRSRGSTATVVMHARNLDTNFWRQKWLNLEGVIRFVMNFGITSCPQLPARAFSTEDKVTTRTIYLSQGRGESESLCSYSSSVSLTPTNSVRDCLSPTTDLPTLATTRTDTPILYAQVLPLYSGLLSTYITREST